MHEDQCSFVGVFRHYLRKYQVLTNTTSILGSFNSTLSVKRNLSPFLNLGLFCLVKNKNIYCL